jgi:MYXO-CTERM domain-containing protein
MRWHRYRNLRLCCLFLLSEGKPVVEISAGNRSEAMRTLLVVAGTLVLSASVSRASLSQAGGVEVELPVSADTQAPEEIWTEPIIGGEFAMQGEWPDVAAVMVQGEVYVNCTGTLIAPQVVLTAGHCISNDINRVKLNTVDTSGAAGEEIAVTRAVAYPNWQQTFDVGLLILAAPSTVKPRAIARGCVNERYYSNTAPVELVGYGAIDAQGQTYADAANNGTLLLRGSADITDSVCLAGKGCNAGVSPGGEIMLDSTGALTCYGDSGGPLYLQTELGDYLVGVTSRGVDNAATPCGVGSIYARADAPAVVSWVEQEAGITLAMPTCAADDGTGNGNGNGDGTGGSGDGSGNGDGTGGGGGTPDPDAPEGSDDNPAGELTSGCGCSAGGENGQGMWLLAVGMLMLGMRRRSML